MFQQTPQNRVTLRRSLTSVLLGVLSIATILYGGFAFHPQKTYAATNGTVNFQARLEGIGGAIAADGLYNIQFKLYSASSGGSALWTESYYDSNGVTAGNDNRVQVTNGYVTVNLGSQTAFPAIDWDQDLYLTMNVGGTTQTATPTYDGEMSPRLKLTGVPYAFRAGQLAQFNATSGFTSTLSLLQPTVGAQAFQVKDQTAAGTYTICVQGATTALGGCAASTGGTGYIQNQNAGAQSTSNFWISGTGRADTALQAPLFDTPSGTTTLNIGTTNATAINLNQNTTIAATKTLTVTSGATSLTGATTGDALTVSNNSSTGNILVLKDNATTVATVADGGAATFQNSVNSARGFNIQNAAGSDLFSLDTTGEAGNVITNGSVEVNATNWSARGSATVTRGTTPTYPAYYGNASVRVVTGGVANDGAKYDVTLATSTTYTASFYAKLLSSTFTNMSMGYSSTGLTGGEVDCKTNMTVVTGGWSQFNCTFTTPGTSSGTPYFYMTRASGTSREFYIDGFHIIPGSNIGTYYETTINNTGVFGQLAVQGVQDSQTSFQVQSSTGISVLGVDTINQRVGIGTNSSSARLHVYTITSGAIGEIIQGVNSQAGDLLQFQDNNQVVLSRVTSAGDLQVASSVDRATSGTLTVGGANANAIALVEDTTITGNLAFAVGGNRTISVNTQTTSNTAGNNLTVQSATGNGTGAGGTLTLQGGTSGSGATGNGGALTITGGNAASTNGSGGDVTISAGTKTGSGTAGSVIVKPQASSDKTTFFQVQNAAGTAVLNVDTTNQQLSVRNLTDTASLGSELITISDFTNAAWTKTGWSVSSTVATHTTGNTNVLSTTQITVVAGNYYLIAMCALGSPPAGETVTPGIGGASGRAIEGNCSTFTEVVKATTTGALTFTPTSNYNGNIQNISVKLLTLNTSALAVVDSAGTTRLEVRATSQITAVGLGAAQSSTTASALTAFGANSLANNTTGGNNTAVGRSSLTSNTSGSSNTAVGDGALLSNVNGSNNTATGATALTSNTTGYGNTAYGYNTLANNTSGIYNTALGFEAGHQDPNVGTFVTLTNLQNATAIGYGAQVQLSNSLILGGQGASAVNVGIGTTSPTNTFSVSPDVYDTGTAGTSASATVVGVGTTWTSSMVGMEFVFANGNKYTITGFTDTTHMTLSASSSNASQAYRIHNPAFYVSSTGQALHRTSTNSTTAFQVQNAAGTGVLVVDTTNSELIVQGINETGTTGTELMTGSNTFGAASGWGSISGTGQSATATHSSGGGTTAIALSPSITATNGVTYRTSVTVSGRTTGTVTFRLNGGGTNVINSNGTSTFDSVGDGAAITFIPTNTFDGTITAVSIKTLSASTPVTVFKNSDGTAGLEVRAGGTGLNNTFLGVLSGQFNTTGARNTAIGYNSLKSNIGGADNTATGYQALQNATGGHNTANGSSALAATTSGGDNTALGYQALQTNITGGSNTAVGSSALSASTGSTNTAIGSSALSTNGAGSGNTAGGSSALFGNTTGNNNTGFGSSALDANQSGSNNTAIGYRAFGTDPTVAAFISGSALSNATAIGYASIAQASNSIILGGQGANAVNVGIGTTSPTNTFSVSPDIYDTGTASTSASATVVGSGTTWTSSMVGMEFIFGNGNKYTITGFTDTTHMTLSASSTNSSQAYRIHNPAFFVTSTGQASHRNSTDSTTAFQVQNAAGNSIFNVDTTGSQIVLGKASSVNGKIVFQNSGGANTATIVSGATSSSYTLTLPTALGASGDCLKDTNGSGALGFGSCAAGGTTLQSAYTASTSPEITLDATRNGLTVRNMTSDTISTNLLEIQNNAGTANFLGVSKTAVSMQDASGNDALVFDSTNSVLKVYENVSTPSNYASISYASGAAIFAASSGTTQIGSGSGNVTSNLTGASDVFSFSKTYTPGAGYSLNDFTIQRALTAAAFSTTGSVLKIEDVSSGSAVAPNVLLVNQNNASATGNLIVAQLNGTNKFSVSTAGNLTAAGNFISGSSTGVATSCSAGQAVIAGTTVGGIVTAGTCTAVDTFTTLQEAYTNSSSPADILLTDAKNFSITAADTSTDPNVLINLQCVTSCSSNGRFAVQNAGTDVFRVNPSGSIVVGDATNNMTFDATTKEFTLNGTGRHTRRLSFTPEFAGGVMTADGANNTGTMTSDFCSKITSGLNLDTTSCPTTGDQHSFYNWTTSAGSSQDYDIFVRIPLPNDFSAWCATSNCLPTVYAYTWDNAASGWAADVTCAVYDTAGVSAIAAANIGPSSASNWQENNVTATAAAKTWTAGGYMMIDFHVTAQNTKTVKLGEIRLDYLSKW